MSEITGTPGNDTLTGTGDADTISGQGGNDTINAGAGDDTANGDDGSDTLNGQDGNDTLNGGNGDDFLVGGIGNNLLLGGDGNDVVRIESFGDRFDGGIGTDRVFIFLVNSNVGGTLDLSTLAAPTLPAGSAPGFANIEQIEGTILGSGGDDVITLGANVTHTIRTPGSFGSFSLGTNATTDGGAGNDILGGHAGSDLITGGTGNDTINGNGSNDTLYGGDGDDVISGGAGSDNMFGEVGNDILYGGDSDDILRTGNGNGTGLGQTDYLYGEDGNDFGVVETLTGAFDGGAGADRVQIRFATGTTAVVANLTNLATTGAGMIGGFSLIGVESLYGTIATAGGNDVITLGQDTTHSVFDPNTNTFSSLVRVTTGAGDDVVTGSAGADDINGGDGVDTLTGFAGNDVLIGNNGDDILTSGAGQDSLYGGAGDDRLIVTGLASLISGGATMNFSSPDDFDTLSIDLRAETTGVTIDFTNNWNQQNGIFGSGTIFGVEFIGTSDYGPVLIVDPITGALTLSDDFNRYLDGSQGNDNITIGLAYYTSVWLYGNGGNDTLSGTNYADILDGGSGDDVIYGFGGNDLITGGAGIGSIYGGDGDDRISGGVGSGVVDGGNGNDAIAATLTVFGGATISGGSGTDELRLNTEAITTSLTLDFTNFGVNGGPASGGLATINGFESVATIRTGSGNDQITFAAGATWALDIATGDGADTVLAGAGNDVIDVGLGNNMVNGRAGNDIISGTLSGGTFDGGDGNDRIRAALTGAGGTLIGGNGTDALMLDMSSQSSGFTLDLSNFLSNGTIAGNVGATASGFEALDFIAMGSGDDVITLGSAALGTVQLPQWPLNVAGSAVQSGAGNDIITGGNGFDFIVSGAGADTVYGMGGNDFVFVTDTSDILLDGGTQVSHPQLGNFDVLIVDFSQQNVGVDIDLTAMWSGGDGRIGNAVVRGFEALAGGTLSVGSTGPAFEYASYGGLNGSQGNDIIVIGAATNGAYVYGLDGDDSLSGGANVYLYGGFGNDTLHGNIMLGEEGDDVGYGNSGQNNFIGGPGADTYHGGSGQDIVTGDIGSGGLESLYAGNDTLFGNGGNDVLEGNGGNDNLIGGEGNDQLWGQTGLDIMQGGTGDDLYIDVAQGETIIEFAGEGFDTIYTAATAYTMPEHVERLIYQSANSAPTVIIGSSTDNSIAGGNGNDILAGREGNDVLNGLGGANQLIGGTGNDLYHVNVATTLEAVLNTVFEAAGEGNDEVMTTAGIFALDWFGSSELERLTFTDNGNHGAGIGNGFDNVITGGTGIDELFGRAGNDTLIGGSGSANSLYGQEGDDIYVVSAVGDSVIEFAAQGTDTVQASVASFTLGANVENLTFAGADSARIGVGNALGNILRGLGGADSLNGADGDDVIIASSGADILQGGSGADQFRYEGGESGMDRILDFVSGTDKIALNSAFFTPTGTVSFVSGASVVATSANSTILYDTNTGIVWYDDDGNGAGAAVALAQLNAGQTFTAGDFLFY